ncbi:MBL fold metallo-hydrolase [Haloplanus aerogenes]|uniref:MBL fold metallo-hydrolase n=1 Tax=Haloplanus aerogenes TaxID=660522 RepID=A0A3M0DSR0_9EURY|nr:MBL fold metallo-hydrolase [Haloplanus aerogenes]AZH25432.1 MBL fold metallo-hydrolase [Haloplanus aerogenes]RMB25144.1 ribonuclease BN (tRNA processing enzyme) [Haloplanus aerogenes]
MRLTFLGTGSAMPLPDRAQTGLLLERDDRRLLVDCGAGVLHRLAATDPGYEGVSTVLLTHHHLDHVADLLPLLKARWLSGDDHLEIVGPSGTKALVDDLFDAFDYLDGRADVRIREVGAYDFSVAGFDVSAHETRHSVDGLAYRFGGEDGDLTISSDTEAFEGLAAFADGSAIFVHDCSFPDDVDVSNHPTPAKLGDVLAGHDYGRVYLTHLYPHTEGRHEEMLDAIERRYDGDVRFARDGLRVEC